jgi:hypothetical protein
MTAAVVSRDFDALFVDPDARRRAARGVAIRRSEERRVGKECRRLCRSRWSPYH